MRCGTAISNLQLGPGTAIGDGIARACRRSLPSRAKTQPATSHPPPARIVLISDGETTRGHPERDRRAAGAAKNMPGVSTIAYGTQDGTLTIQGQEIAGAGEHGSAPGSIAEETNGSYYRATTGDELKSVYQGLGSSIGYDTKHR